MQKLILLTICNVVFINGLTYKYADRDIYKKEIEGRSDLLKKNHKKFDLSKIENSDSKKLKNLNSKDSSSPLKIQKIDNSLLDLLYEIALYYSKLRNYVKCIDYCDIVIQAEDSNYVKALKCFAMLKIGILRDGINLAKKIEQNFEFMNGIFKRIKEENLEKYFSFFLSNTGNLSESSNDLIVLPEKPISNSNIEGLSNNLINNQLILKVLTSFLIKKKVHLVDLLEILKFSYELLSNLDNINFIDTEKDVLVFGDTHGNFFDTFGVFHKIEGINFNFQVGFEFDKNKIFIFNGDFIDRGKYSIENYTFLLILKILYPENIFLNRGNHEFDNLCRKGEFYEQINLLYQEEAETLFDAFLKTFTVLSLATIINQKVFVVHGGLPRKVPSIDDILELDRKKYVINENHRNHKDSEIVLDDDLALVIGLVWSDPDEENKTKRRCHGICWTQSATQEFKEKNGILFFVRSHSFPYYGFKLNHNGEVITVFSSPEYKKFSNKGAYLIFNSRNKGTEICDGLFYDIESFGKWPKENVTNLDGYTFIK
ncbi:hypothetical protein GVAV_002640 [Gurleya vavrai]